ncbi:MAG: GDSL-type esterase/lipase family protein [Azonexus sp.]|nr:GDSL-type esterase/lipase family protein [Azonexus sp.]
MNRRDFVLMTIALASLSGCSKKAKQSALSPGSKILAFGDSVTFGTGAGPGEDWPSLLAALSGWQIINAGVPGDTAEAGKARIQALLNEHQPALVIIETGGNDFLRRRPVNAVKEDVRQLIRHCVAAGAKVVLIGVPELSVLAVIAGKPSDSPLYAQLANEESVPVISDVFSNVLAQPELCSDKIHPNAQGYRQMANSIFAGLREIGLAR